MKKYCIADIHGNLFAWTNLMKKINVQSSDEVYILGDVIDRGQYGIQILQEIMRKPNFKMILGNHEFMMLDALGYNYDDIHIYSQEKAIKLWGANGSLPTIRGFNKLSKTEQNDIIQYLTKLPLTIHINVNNKNIRLIHAAPEERNPEVGSDPNSESIYRSSAEFAVWDREFVLHPFPSINNDLYILGHTPTISITRDIKEPASIYINDNIIDIDCGAGIVGADTRLKAIGRLAALELTTMDVVYSDTQS